MCCVLRERHPRSPGLRRLETALELVDAGAQSPRESYLRLLLIEAGLPRPQTQIPVLGVDGIPVAYLDMGWQEWLVAVEYDGEQHRSDRRQYVKDIRRLEMLQEMGWTVVRVVAEDALPLSCAESGRPSRLRVCASGFERALRRGSQRFPALDAHSTPWTHTRRSGAALDAHSTKRGSAAL